MPDNSSRGVAARVRHSWTLQFASGKGHSLLALLSPRRLPCPVDIASHGIYKNLPKMILLHLAVNFSDHRMRKSYFLSFLLVLSFFLASCKKESEQAKQNPPQIATAPAPTYTYEIIN